MDGTNLFGPIAGGVLAPPRAWRFGSPAPNTASRISYAQARLRRGNVPEPTALILETAIWPRPRTSALFSLFITAMIFTGLTSFFLKLSNVWTEADMRRS
jgi:hypothetical protein